MYLLTTRDLTDFNVRKVPVTDALMSQKLFSCRRWIAGISRCCVKALTTWASPGTIGSRPRVFGRDYTSWCERGES